MIIGLMGLKGAGKDTVAAYLIKEHGFERKSFAEPLKRSVAALFDIPFEKVDEWKNDDCVRVKVEFDSVSYDEMYSDLSFRKMLQRFGTESHRDVFGSNFWVDMCLPLDAYYTGRKIVVTDCRFKNEAHRIHYNLGGYIVRVERPGLDSQDRHSSEQELSEIQYHYRLANDGSLYELGPKIEEMLNVLGENDVGNSQRT